jgi:uncharacterized protein
MANSHGRFIWYELATTDMAAARAFYADVVGWGALDASRPGAGYTLFTAAGTSVSGLTELSESATKIGLRPGWLGYIGADDVVAAAERTTALGGAVHIPPTEVPNVSRFSVAADPQGVTFALFKWLNSGPPSEPRPPPQLHAPGHVGWHELVAADWEQAWRFYGELFGWQKAETDVGPVGPYQSFSADGETIGGMFTKPAAVPVPFWLFYFNVVDVDAALKRVKAGGGKVIEGPVEVLGGKCIAHCTDPQGAIFALIGRRHDAIGYFERVTVREPAHVRFGLRKRPDE